VRRLDPPHATASEVPETCYRDPAGYDLPGSLSDKPLTHETHGGTDDRAAEATSEHV
jgi:hypothetical protein